MIINSVNLDDLEENAETAFVTFEERLRSVLKEQQDEDARMYRGDDGYYAGSHSPERYYVSSILAFLDEYGLDIDVEDISDLRDDAFLLALTSSLTRSTMCGPVSSSAGYGSVQARSAHQFR